MASELRYALVSNDWIALKAHGAQLDRIGHNSMGYINEINGYRHP